MLVTVTSKETGAARGDSVVGAGEFAVGECGVTEAVAEGIERSALEVAVGAALHRVILEGRQLAYVLVKGDGEAAGGIVLAGESLGHGRAALFARIPGFEDGVGVVLGPVDAERAAVGEDNHQRLAGGGHSFKQFLLGLGQVDAGAVAA